MDGGTAEGKTSEQLLDGYFNSPAVIDAQGSVLNDSLIQDAANVVVNVYNGYIDRIILTRLCSTTTLRCSTKASELL